MFTFRRNRIITFASPGVTSGNSFRSQPETFKKTMNTERFNHIMRACRFVTAVFWQNRRDEPLIKSYQEHQRKCDDFVEHCIAKIAK